MLNTAWIVFHTTAGHSKRSWLPCWGAGRAQPVACSYSSSSLLWLLLTLLLRPAMFKTVSLMKTPPNFDEGSQSMLTKVTIKATLWFASWILLVSDNCRKCWVSINIKLIQLWHGCGRVSSKLELKSQTLTLDYMHTSCPANTSCMWKHFEFRAGMEDSTTNSDNYPIDR